MYWCTRMVGSTRSGKPTDIDILTNLRMLATGGSGDKIEDVT